MNKQKICMENNVAIKYFYYSDVGNWIYVMEE
jgi:hypothetical protein